MKTLFLLPLFFFALSLAAPQIDDSSARLEFKQFQRKFNKTYATRQEEEHRFEIFKQNLISYKEHNDKNLGWTEGVTKFSDLTKSEFRTRHLNGYVNTYKEYSGERPPPKGSISEKQSPPEMDWLAAITPVKDQGSCGSCWAFATVESIESYAYLNDQSSPIVELSPQHINSCTPSTLGCGGNGGCSGSIPQLGFGYTQLYGVQAEASYPYISGTTGVTGACNHDPANDASSVSAAYVRGYELLPRNDYDAVMSHLANVGPLAVAIDSSAWGAYSGGVFDGCPYNENIQINHAVQLVGYGTDETLGDYWLIRNSWGTTWGEEGFIRMKRNSVPMCGNDDTPLYGTGCVNDGVPNQYVCGTCGILFDASYPIGAYYV